MKRESDHVELRLHQSCENNTGYWVNADTFDEMWSRDKNGSYLAEYSGPPRSNFFSLSEGVDEIALLTPCVQIMLDNDSVFVHSRPDGVRWLLDHVVGDEIPVSIYRDTGIEKGGRGLILRPVLANDVIRVKNGFHREKIIAQKLVRRAMNYNGIFNGVQPVSIGTQLSLF